MLGRGAGAALATDAGAETVEFETGVVEGSDPAEFSPLRAQAPTTRDAAAASPIHLHLSRIDHSVVDAHNKSADSVV